MVIGTKRRGTDDRGLPLVRDPDRREVGRSHARLLQSVAQSTHLRVPDLQRIVLHPARPGKELAELMGLTRDDVAGVIEEDRARARGALIEGSDVLRHGRGL